MTDKIDNKETGKKTREDLFVLAYMKYRNQVRAYMEVYPTAAYSTAVSQASRKMQEPAIKKAIKELTEELVQKSKFDLESAVSEMETLATSNMQDYINIDGEIDTSTLTREQMAAIETVETERFYCKVKKAAVTKTKIKLYSKYNAIKAIGQHLGGFSSKVEVDANLSLADKLSTALERVERDREC
mgnify:CR=1 FL=1